MLRVPKIPYPLDPGPTFFPISQNTFSSKNCSRCSSYQRKTIHRGGLQCQTSNNESQCQNEFDGKHVRANQTCNYIHFQFGSL